MSWRDDNRTFAHLGMYTWNALAFSGEGEPERVNGATVTANLFPLLGIAPMLGRGFLAEEEHTGPDRVVLLGYGLWQRRFGALGASRRQVVGLVVRQGAVLAGIGVAAGLAGAFALTRVLATLLHGVRVTDVTIFVGIPVLLGAVAVVASWLPARRAARIDPLVAMRSE